MLQDEGEKYPGVIGLDFPGADIDVRFERWYSILACKPLNSIHIPGSS